jgi:alkaline phosphatase D
LTPPDRNILPLSRRQFLLRSALTCGALVTSNSHCQAKSLGVPAIAIAESDQPKIPDGVATGDVGDGGVLVWSRSDRPSRLIVEYSGDESFRNP